MIARADEDRAPLEVVRRNAAGNRAELNGERFDPAETAARFGQLVDARARRLRDGGIGCSDRAAAAGGIHL